MQSITLNQHYTGYAESLIGGRTENQDDYGYANTPLGYLLVVCDGMGGGPAGKTASSTATNAIVRHMMATTIQDNPQDSLLEAINLANQELIALQKQNTELVGMGTTAVALLLTTQEKAYIAHVGDSRCYQFRGSNMTFRTSDHSYVGELVRRGAMTEEQARTAGNSNIITRAIGVRPELETELDIVSFKPGDRFALMTDGIWGAMPQDELITMLTQKSMTSDIVGRVVQAVETIGLSKGGGHDNLTLAVLDVNKQSTIGFSRKRTDTVDTHKQKPVQPIIEEMKEDDDVVIPGNYTSRRGDDDYVGGRGHGRRGGFGGSGRGGSRMPSWMPQAIAAVAVLAVVGIVCMALGVFSGKDKTDEGKQGDSVTVVTTPGQISDPGEKQEMVDKVLDDNQKKQEETQQEEEPATDNNAYTSALSEASTILAQMDTLGDWAHKNRKSVSADAMKSRRGEMRGRALASLDKAIANAPADKKEKLQALRERIEKSNIVNGIDNSGLSWKETKDNIKKYQSDISSLK